MLILLALRKNTNRRGLIVILRVNLRFTILQFPVTIVRHLVNASFGAKCQTLSVYEMSTFVEHNIFMTSTKDHHFLKLIFYVDPYNIAPYNSTQDVHYR